MKQLLAVHDGRMAGLTVACLLVLADSPVLAQQDRDARIAANISALDGDDSDARDRAEAALLAERGAAIKFLAPAALAGAFERRFRATRILGRLARDGDEATANAAQAALKAVAAGKDMAVAKQAEEALAPFARLATMRLFAKAFRLANVANPDEPVEIPLIEKPLLRFQDTERTHYDGTLWAYGAAGRPRAMLCVYSWVDPGMPTAGWSSDVVTLSATPLRAASVDGVEGQGWSPAKSDEEFRLFAEAPSPANDATERLTQARQLLSRLAAREAWPPTAPAKALTLAPDVLYRYSDKDAAIADGMVFAFTHDTNPEILVLLEVQVRDGSRQWLYRFARQAAASLWVELDGKEVWSSPSPTDYQVGGNIPYWNFRRQLPK